MGHVVAAAFADDHPDVLLGAALPDLAPRGRLHLDDAPDALRRGVALHRRADEVFHHDPRFIAATAALRAELDERGLARGAARAAAHAGVELLIDGVLLGSPTASDSFRTVWNRLAAGDQIALGVAGSDDRDRWEQWLRAVTTRLDPWRHTESVHVAFRIERLLASRPRLALAAGDQVALAAALDTVSDTVVAMAAAITDDTGRRAAPAAAPDRAR